MAPLNERDSFSECWTKANRPEFYQFFIWPKSLQNNDKKLGYTIWRRTITVLNQLQRSNKVKVIPRFLRLPWTTCKWKIKTKIIKYLSNISWNKINQIFFKNLSKQNKSNIFPLGTSASPVGWVLIEKILEIEITVKCCEILNTVMLNDKC